MESSFFNDPLLEIAMDQCESIQEAEETTQILIINTEKIIYNKYIDSLLPITQQIEFSVFVQAFVKL